MKIKDTIPDWITKFQWHYDHYAGKLIRLYGLSEKDAGVYIYLFTQRWYFNQSNIPQYKILTELNKIHNEYIPNESNSKYNTRSVSESLDRLESLGFVKKFSNVTKRNNGGSPGKFLYSPSKVVDLETFTQNRLDKTRGDMIDLLQELEQVEEARGWRKGNGNTEEN